MLQALTTRLGTRQSANEPPEAGTSKMNEFRLGGANANDAKRRKRNVTDNSVTGASIGHRRWDMPENTMWKMWKIGKNTILKHPKTFGIFRQIYTNYS